MKPLAALICGALALPAQADFIGVYAGAGLLQGSPSGTLGADSLDIEDDFGLGNEKQNFQAYVAFEHPIPLLPNIKVTHMAFDTDGKGTLEQDFDFGGIEIPAGYNTATDLDYEHMDVVLYYELWDTLFDLDLGLAGRKLDVAVNMDFEFDDDGIVTSGTTAEDVEEWVPMAYGAARVDLPLTGLYVAGEIMGTGYKDSSLLDYQVKLGWTYSLVAAEFGLEAGYRQIGFDVSEDDFGDLTTDIDIDAWFLNAVFHF